jgi:ketosteroid isomerase-like protein
MGPIRFILLAALALSPLVAAAAHPDDVAAATRTVTDYNAAWMARDVDRYASLCADDYLIVEAGRITDLQQDLAWLRAHPWRDGRSRVDVRKAWVRGDCAHVIYALDFRYREDGSPVHKRYFETASLRRTTHGWRIFLVSSTELHETNP